MGAGSSTATAHGSRVIAMSSEEDVKKVVQEKKENYDWSCRTVGEIGDCEVTIKIEGNEHQGEKIWQELTGECDRLKEEFDDDN